MENSASVVSTDDLIGVNVKNPTGDKLGDIDKLVLDKITGKVCYVALSVGGFLGIGEKCVAAPWKALHYDKTQDCFILNANKETLKNVDALADNWTNWSDKTWGENIHRHYGLSPYWNDKQNPDEVRQKVEPNVLGEPK